jgi:MoxR-like ATPase
MAVKERIKHILDQLNEGIYEKEEVIALALLSSIAGESIFLLGPPGVAKSLIARQLKYAYKDATAFEYLMSRFSTPDEIFGPVSISELKKDKYVRNVKGYLPDASVVFLDEIWKAGPSIQNALLTILNEKIFRNGDKDIHVPMKALISASNELPAKDDEIETGQSLEALWDRFLVRCAVGGIFDDDKFNEMISARSKTINKEVDNAITDDEYNEWKEKIDKIEVPDEVFRIIKDIKKALRDYNRDKKRTNRFIFPTAAGKKS